MKSAPYAISWELLARGRWSLLSTSLLGVAIPAIFLAALKHDGPLRPEDPAMINLHLSMAIITVFFCGCALLVSQGQLARLFSLPIPTNQIVTWRMLPGAVVIALQYAFATLIINHLFGVNWPVFGPALGGAVALCAVTAVMWFADKSVLWLAFGVGAVGAAIGIWIKSRYGSAFHPALYYWRDVSWLDTSVLLLVCASAYLLGVFAVSRNRRGEPPISLGVAEWLDRQFERRGEAKQFRSIYQAQSWSEWQRKGWAMPIGILGLTVILVAVWIYFDRQPEHLINGGIAGCFCILMLASIGGLIFGNTGRNDGNYAMGHFLATRPISDSDLARIILLAIAKSLLLTWLAWAVALAAATACIAAVFGIESVKLSMGFGYLSLVIIPLSSWMITSVLACLGLVGRGQLIFQVFCALIGSFFLGVLISLYVLPPDAGRIFVTLIFVLAALAIVGGTAYIFVEACRRSLVRPSTAWITACVWTIMLMAFAATTWQWEASTLLVFAAFLALVVVPIAAAPLAISLNRHR